MCQISILEWILNDHVTLKTAEMAVKNSAEEPNDFVKYFKHLKMDICKL